MYWTSQVMDMATAPVSNLLERLCCEAWWWNPCNVKPNAHCGMFAMRSSLSVPTMFIWFDKVCSLKHFSISVIAAQITTYWNFSCMMKSANSGLITSLKSKRNQKLFCHQYKIKSKIPSPNRCELPPKLKNKIQQLKLKFKFLSADSGEKFR